MNRNLMTVKADFPTLFRIAKGASEAPAPFAREILLLECHIAGTSHRPDIEQLAETLAPGAKFALRREPANEFDENAIAIYDACNKKIGYIPKTQNKVLARLLEAGKRLSAKLVAKEWQNSWLKLDIEVFLHD